MESVSPPAEIASVNARERLVAVPQEAERGESQGGDDETGCPANLRSFGRPDPTQGNFPGHVDGIAMLGIVHDPSSVLLV